MVKGKTDFRTLAHVQFSRRLRELALLIVAIILGMLISGNVRAQEPRHKIYKAKKACLVLAQKRNRPDNIRVAIKKPKYKPQAEMEAPAAYRISARRETKDNKGIQR